MLHNENVDNGKVPERIEKMKNKIVSILTGGGGPAEPVAERHPQSDPSEKLTIAVKQSVLTDGVKATAKGGEPAPVRVSETGRARNWTMPPLRLERECKERTNSATIDNRCVEFDRRESTESTAIIGLRALGRRIAFTMAEILLSLTIIGVVAAITLPSLTGNINERTWNTQRKALYARFSQAIALMPSLNGYGTLKEETDSAGSTSIEDTAAETFVTAGLSKVLKINNICDSEHLEDCGIPSKITTYNGSVLSSLPHTVLELNSFFSRSTENHINNYSFLDTKVAAFETANGESIAVYYNPKCVYKQEYAGSWAYINMQPEICANFVYDLNGSKGPNTVGKDIGTITALYASDSKVVAPQLKLVTASNNVPTARWGEYCRERDSNYRFIDADSGYSVWMNKTLWGISGGFATSTTIIQNNQLKRKVVEAVGSVWAMPIEELDSYSSTIYCIERY